MYSLFRNRDGAGDSGNMSLAIWLDIDGNVKYEHNARPRVGVLMRVGSAYARTMTSQDWWQTTLIEEILEESEGFVKFRTENGSIYEWRCNESQDTPST